MSINLIVLSLMLLLIGLSLLLLTVWSWRGRSSRSRWWMRSWEGDSVALVVLPTATLAVLLFSVAVFAPSWLRVLVVYPPLAVGAWGTLVALVSPLWWPAHRLWGPRWYSRMSKEDVQNQERGGTISASARQLGAGSTADRRPAWLGTLVTSFWGNLLLDRANPSRRNVARGALRVFENGFRFEATGAAPQSGAGHDTALPWEEITAARVVSDRSNGSGEPVSGLLDRSFLTRLVVTTRDDAFLFEVTGWNARRVAECITQNIGGTTEA
ncbi:hypothetical protein [Leucobacter sp. M11]|uniref:hypothetical protein n=1 Tax=Leucobacter sp. M11 TaxID=2993565 RepID=UPI002D80C268|nr:hypothetical protein [Leucobacter sp. M11]MEB4613122.1 hypothetical protein [Leucobacter sp. M11]